MSTPTGTELAEDEFILHIEGTAGTQRVVRHIGTTSWPGHQSDQELYYFWFLQVLAFYVDALVTFAYECYIGCILYRQADSDKQGIVF